MTITDATTDQGWAWVILVVCFINLLICSIGQSAGIFNVFFIQEFQHESKAFVASAGVLIPSLTTFAGPLASVLISCLSPRVALLIGAAATFTGLVLTSFAESFIHLFITFGLLSGFGLGICYATSLYILGFYFEKHRNVAFGIVLSAMGIGMMAFPPLLHLLYKEFLVRGAILVTGALSAHLLFSVLLTPAKLPERYVIENKMVEAFTDNDVKQTIQMCEYDKVFTKEQESEQEKVESNESTSFCNDKMKSVKHFNNSVTQENKHPDISQLSIDSKKSQMRSDFESSNEKNSSKEQNEYNCITHNNKNGSCIRRFQKLCQLKLMIFCLYIFVIHVGLSSIRLHFPAYAIEQGTSLESSSYLVTIFGLGNTISRLTVGIITNKRHFLMYVVNLICCIATVIICCVGPCITKQYIGQITFSLLFSFFGNGFQSISAPIAIDLVGLDLFNVANGTLLMLSGLGILIGPIIAGRIVDVKNTYFYTFIISSTSYSISAILMLCIICMKHNTKK